MGDAPDRENERKKKSFVDCCGVVARNYPCAMPVNAGSTLGLPWERSVHSHPSLWYMSQACRNCLELTTSYLLGYHRYGRNLELEQLYLFRDLFLHAVSTSTS